MGSGNNLMRVPAALQSYKSQLHLESNKTISADDKYDFNFKEYKNNNLNLQPVKQASFQKKYLRNNSVLTNPSHPTKAEERLLEHHYLSSSVQAHLQSLSRKQNIKNYKAPSKLKYEALNLGSKKSSMSNSPTSYKLPKFVYTASPKEKNEKL